MLDARRFLDEFLQIRIELRSGRAVGTLLSYARKRPKYKKKIRGSGFRDSESDQLLSSCHLPIRTYARVLAEDQLARARAFTQSCHCQLAKSNKDV